MTSCRTLIIVTNANANLVSSKDQWELLSKRFFTMFLLSKMTMNLLFFLCCMMALQSVASFSGVNNPQRVFLSTPVSKHPKNRVVDCMTSPPVLLSPAMSVNEATAILLSNGFSGAPVVDDSQRLIGVVSSFDFLEMEAFEGRVHLTRSELYFQTH
jgi:CBS domain-containing protein